MCPHGRSPEARHSLSLVVGSGGGGKLNMVPVLFLLKMPQQMVTYGTHSLQV